MHAPSTRAVVTAVFFAFAIGLGLWAGAMPVLMRQSGPDAAGLGTACVVPCCFALVARQAADRAAGALGVASLVAGLIRLPTPLCLGYVAAAFSGAVAFAAVAAGLLAAALIALRGRRTYLTTP